MNKISINERELRDSIRRHLIEQDSNKEKGNEDQKPRCVAGNVIPLDMMIGPSDKFSDYTSSVLKRDGGINGMVDTLDVLRTLAHELTHYKQYLKKQLNKDSGKTGSPQENEAHAKAGIIMRHFNKLYPNLINL